jgi:protein involved in ribonucleotide reduction
MQNKKGLNSMKLVYASRTGNVEKLVGKLGAENALKISNGNETVSEPCILITYTDGVGIIPPAVETFVKNNKDNITAAAVSGNKERHPDTFCFAADKLKDNYGITILTTFNKEGDDETVTILKNALN